MKLAELFEGGEELPTDRKKSLFHYIVATKLFEKTGLEDMLQWICYRRASLARNMLPEDVTRIAPGANKWLHEHGVQ